MPIQIHVNLFLYLSLSHRITFSIEFKSSPVAVHPFPITFDYFVVVVVIVIVLHREMEKGLYLNTVIFGKICFISGDLTPKQIERISALCLDRCFSAKIIL